MIKETKCDFEVIEKKEKSKFKIDKNNIKIDIYDEKLVINIIDKKFKKKYKEILSLLEENDEDSNNEDIVLIKIDELTYLLNKYYKYLPKDKLLKYISMINLVKEKILNPVLNTGKSR